MSGALPVAGRLLVVEAVVAPSLELLSGRVDDGRAIFVADWVEDTLGPVPLNKSEAAGEDLDTNMPVLIAGAVSDVKKRVLVSFLTAVAVKAVTPVPLGRI